MNFSWKALLLLGLINLVMVFPRFYEYPALSAVNAFIAGWCIASAIYTRDKE